MQRQREPLLPETKERLTPEKKDGVSEAGHEKENITHSLPFSFFFFLKGSNPAQPPHAG